MEYINNVYVINMDESPERLKKITTHLSNLNVPFTRIPAINGKKLSINEVENKATTLCRYFCTSSMIGCFLSHKKAWETMLNNNDQYAIIMEDDCELIDSFKVDLKNVMNELLPSNPDWIYLGCIAGCEANKNNYSFIAYLQTFTIPNIKKSNDPNSLNFSYIPQAPAGTHCYIISNNCAKQLLHYMNKVDYHVDVSFLNHTDKFNVYASKKKLGIQRSSADQSTQATFKFPVTLNYIFDHFRDNNNILYTFYLSTPIFEIFWHPVNVYLILISIFAFFMPNIKLTSYLFAAFLLLEIILQPSNLTIIVHWTLVIYSILYLRKSYFKQK